MNKSVFWSNHPQDADHGGEFEVFIGDVKTLTPNSGYPPYHFTLHTASTLYAASTLQPSSEFRVALGLASRPAKLKNLVVVPSHTLHDAVR